MATIRKTARAKALTPSVIIAFKATAEEAAKVESDAGIYSVSDYIRLKLGLPTAAERRRARNKAA